MVPSLRVSAVAALAAALAAAAQPQPARLPGSPAAVVRMAERAVETRTAAALRSDWFARLRRDPTDRLARFGVVVLSRFAYDHAAVDSLSEPLVSSASRPPDAITAWARLERALAVAQRWRVEDSEAELRAALNEAVAAGDRGAEAGALTRLAVIHGRTQGVDSGLALLDRARRVLPPTDSTGRALMLAYRAQLILARGTPGAQPLADSALRLARRARSPRIEGLVYNLLGREQLRVRRADSAEVLFGRAVDRLRVAGDLVGYAGSLQWRGYLLRVRGELAAAERDLRAARAVGPVAGPLILGWTEINLGQVAMALADWNGARAHLSAGRVLFDSAGDRWGEAAALQTEGAVRWAVRDWRGADSVVREAEARLAASGNTSGVLAARVDRLRYAIARRDWASADNLLALARDTTMRNRSAAWFDLDYYAALLALGTGRPNDARLVLERSGREAARAGDGASYRRTARAAQVEALLGRLDSAESKMRRALDTFERYRAAQETREQRLAALAAAGDVGDADVGMATVVAELARAGRVDAAFEFAERTKARELLDGMARREALRETETDRPSRREAAIARVYTRTVGLDELQASLPDSTAVVHISTGTWHEPTTALIVASAGASAAVLPPADSLIDPVRRLILAVQAGADTRAQARLLGDALLAPIVRALPRSATRLVIVPASPLHTLPFELLELADGARLVERYEVSYAPSASVYAALRRREASAVGAAAAAPGATRGVVVFGAPQRARTGVAAWDTLPPLPAAAAEARDIARLAARVSVRLGRNASETWLKRTSLADVSVLHFATHAVVDPSGLRGTALLLSPGPGEDGVVRPEELSALSLDADLVVLSACGTALSGGHAGDEGLRGLVAPFLEAGARGVAATLWAVDDVRQRELVRRFYARLAAGESPAAALRAAKLAAVRAGAAPRDWAALVLWGDPLARTQLGERP